MRQGYRTIEELRSGIYRALHDVDLSRAAVPLDTAGLVAGASNLIGKEEQNYRGTPFLSVAVQGGPAQQILRPAEIEDTKLREDLTREALFGQFPIFNRSVGTTDDMQGSALLLTQDSGAAFTLNETGGIALKIPLTAAQSTRARRSTAGFPAIIEEVVQSRLDTMLAFVSWAFDLIDNTHRLTHFGIAARIDGADYMGWRTQKEHDASPNSGSVGMGFGRENEIASLTQQRAGLRMNHIIIAEDLTVMLRRHWKQRN